MTQTLLDVPVRTATSVSFLEKTPEADDGATHSGLWRQLDDNAAVSVV